ncbi:MAG: glycosyltransferase family 4 protein [Caldilineaceae bacterium]|nr:glycosyltransferase family 4 protein [Caldilineaceae bacterium]
MAHFRQAGDDVEIVSLPWRSYPRHLADNADRDLLRCLRGLDVDLLLQDELNHPSLWWINQRLRGQVTYPIVGIMHHLRADEEHPWLWMPLYRWVERRYLRTLDAAIYNSESTRRAVTALATTALPGVVALPAADHLRPPAAADIAALLERRRAQTPLRLLSLGTVIPRKGIHHLLAVLARLPLQSWTLDIVGSLDVDPGYVAQLRRHIAELGLTANVLLRGRLSDDDVVEALRRSHALALLSFEGFGIAFLEAMSFGLPVIAARAGAAPDLIDEGVNGFLVDRSDLAAAAAKIALLTNPARRTQMGHAARRRFEQHPTWTDSAARARAFLQSLLTEDD